MESIFINIYQEITLAVGCCIGIMAVMLLRTYIPSMPHLKRLHTARGYLLASYIILSALNFVSAATGYHGIIDRTITLVVSSYQALLITATFIVFIRPNAISQRTIIIHFACITIYSFLLIASILWYPGLYSVAMWLAVTVYTFQLAFYTWWFEKAYKLSVKDVENFYDEDEEARLRWVKKGFYIMLGCGVTALIGLFFNGLYMLLFNILVVVCYTYLASAVQRYMYRMGFLMPVIAEEDKKQTAPVPDVVVTPPESTGNATPIAGDIELGHALEKWVERKEYTLNDVPIEDVVVSLGTTRADLRRYFKENMGEDFRTWRKKLRVKEACHLIDKDPFLKPKHVCQAVGFGDLGNFYKAFKEATGLTPLEYAAMKQKA